MTDIKVRDVEKVFSSSSGDVTALKGIDLDVESGQFVSLLGPSGCGKSTLLRIVADLESITSGDVTVVGKSPNDARLAREYGMVFQQAGLLEWRSVRGNIELPLKIMGLGASERKSRAEEMIDLVRLDGFARHLPWQLSGGMQQRVAIARALAFEPSILLMDEPLGALDEMNREYLQGELMRICAQTGTTVLFVTHSVSEAVFLSSKVCVMSPRPGQIVSEIPIDLPGPRDEATRRDPAFFELVGEVRESLHSVLSSEGTTR